MTAISAGGGDGLFLLDDGSLWGLGWNGDGQLGDGSKTDRYVPTKIVGGGVTAIAAGDGFSLFLKSDGSLWGMGKNDSGQLGDQTVRELITPAPIVAGGVVAIAAGEATSLFLKADGSLWGLGSNGNAQLGDGTKMETDHPVEIVASGVTAMASGDGGTMFAASNFFGDGFTLFLKSNHSLWGLGGNGFGQLGDGTKTTRTQPVQIIPGGVASLAATGSGHSLFLKQDGTAWAMGRNSQGQLGDNSRVNRTTPKQIADNVTAIATGFYHSLLLKGDGSLWTMGWNDNAQLGDGSKTNRLRPVQVATGVTAISGGAGCSLFTKSDGSLWGMGWMGYGDAKSGVGQIGDGSAGSPNRPAQIFPVPAGATQALWPPAPGGALPPGSPGSVLAAVQGIQGSASAFINGVHTGFRDDLTALEVAASAVTAAGGSPTAEQTAALNTALNRTIQLADNISKRRTETAASKAKALELKGQLQEFKDSLSPPPPPTP